MASFYPWPTRLVGYFPHHFVRLCLSIDLVQAISMASKYSYISYILLYFRHFSYIFERKKKFLYFGQILLYFLYFKAMSPIFLELCIPVLKRYFFLNFIKNFAAMHHTIFPYSLYTLLLTETFCSSLSYY